MEKTTTIRLEINGEPAKNTLEALRQRAEVLSQKISAIKFPNSQEINPLDTSATPPIATQQRKSINLTEQQLRDLKRLEQEYAAVTAEIEQQEEALQGVARVMNSIVAENERKEGLGFWGNLFRWPQWFKDKHEGKGVSVGGMTNEQVMELYRVLTDIKYELKSGESSVESGGSNVESGGFSVESIGGVLKIELVNGKTIEIKNARELEAVMQEVLSQMNDFFSWQTTKRS